MLLPPKCPHVLNISFLFLASYIHKLIIKTYRWPWAPTKAETSLTSLVPIYLPDYIHRPQLSLVWLRKKGLYKLKTTKIRIWNLQSTTPPFPGPKNLTNRCSGFDIWVTSYVQFPSPAFKDPKWFARFCPWSKLHMEAAAPASLVIWKKEIP